MVCENCGKHVYTSLNVCIHCGEPAPPLSLANMEKADNAGELFNLAKELSSRGDYEGAVKALTRAIGMAEQNVNYSPKNVAQLYADRGHAYYQTKDYQKALADTQKVLERSPQNAEMWGNAGSIYRHLGDKKNAAECYAQSACRYLKKNKIEKARIQCEKALSLDTENVLAKELWGAVE